MSAKRIDKKKFTYDLNDLDFVLLADPSPPPPSGLSTKFFAVK